ncbi:MAG: hypothetical protein ABSB14_15960 [Candidatus Sulfotelmatobacter sp.]|jgi:hypothetical protein
MKNIKYLGLGFVLALSTIVLNSVAAAQTSSSTPDQSSLGDYARKVRKDPGTKAKPKVFDNDNLPTNDKLSVVGPAPTADASATPAAADTKDKDKDAAAKPAAPVDDEQAKKKALAKGWQDKLTSQKDAIDLASRELDVTQREYQLRAAAMYADVGNRMRNATQWDKEEADYKQKIADKQKALDDAKQKLEDMKEDARKAGVPSAMID